MSTNKDARPCLTADRLRQLLHYDPATGYFWWLASAQGIKRELGLRAGGRTHNGNGYIRIAIDRHNYYAHRLAWLYVHGEWPSGQIDHANGNPSDNRLCNLRQASQSQQLANTKFRRIGSVTGHKGVAYVDDPRRRKRFYVRVCFEGKIYRGGYFLTAKEAAAARKALAKKVHKEFSRDG